MGWDGYRGSIGVWSSFVFPATPGQNGFKDGEQGQGEGGPQIEEEEGQIEPPKEKRTRRRAACDVVDDGEAEEEIGEHERTRKTRCDQSRYADASTAQGVDINFECEWVQIRNDLSLRRC